MSPPKVIEFEGVPMHIRHHPRARRVILRIDPVRAAVLLTLPPGVSERKGLAYAREKRDWLFERLKALQPHQAFIPGASIPFKGGPHLIEHAPEMTGVVRRGNGRILVSGAPAHLPRRLADWLRQQARRDIADRAFAKAALIERRPKRITLRDPKSRWGSCSASGALSFSWRLIMAPDFVLDYVVAHEVAHLVEHHHGPSFHRLVDKLTPATAEARAWLADNGSSLHRYG